MGAGSEKRRRGNLRRGRRRAELLPSALPFPKITRFVFIRLSSVLIFFVRE